MHHLRGMLRLLHHVAALRLQLLKKRPEMPAFNRQAAIPRPALNLFLIPLDARQIHHTEGCGIFEVGHLPVPFPQHYSLRPRAFGIVLFSGVVADLILCNCLEHNKPYSAKAVPDMLRNNGTVVAQHVRVPAPSFSAASGSREKFPDTIREFFPLSAAHPGLVPVCFPVYARRATPCTVGHSCPALRFFFLARAGILP